MTKPISVMGDKSIHYIVGTDQRTDKNLWSRFTLKIEGIRCIWNCNPPPPDATDDLPIVTKKWSEVSTWFPEKKDETNTDGTKTDTTTKDGTKTDTTKSVN